jgi:hypothetical protein
MAMSIENNTVHEYVRTEKYGGGTDRTLQLLWHSRDNEAFEKCHELPAHK